MMGTLEEGMLVTPKDHGGFRERLLCSKAPVILQIPWV
jgi:hypothetical protein